MSKSTLAAIAAASTAFMLACQDSATSPTEAEFEPPQPQFDFTNGPATPGPNIVRFSNQDIWGFFSSGSELVTILATDNGFDGLGGRLGCPAGTATFQPVNFQFLLSPSGAVLFHGRAKEVFAAVYDFTGLVFPAGLSCAFLSGPRKLAEGTAQRVSNDNDAFVSGTRPNTFGDRIGGQLENVWEGGSGRVQFNQVFRAVILKDGTDKILKDEITLRPDPRG